jgi:eukaryotic-like serine/threonine-protein kinase
MRATAASTSEQDLDRFIAAFEAAQVDLGTADLADFLPDRIHPLYLQVLRELVRVDLEFTWARGQGRPLDHYRRTFPELFDDFQSVEAVCFEEYRLRRQAGEAVLAEEYQRHYGVDTQFWAELPQPSDTLDFDCRQGNGLAGSSRPSPCSAPLSPGASGHAPAPAMPKPGQTLLGFELVDELGRGAFATVFLARQGSLADRFVALKISRTRIEESGILARLQHTNIVPVYSVHRHGVFHVICMPFYGSTTLAEFIRGLRGKQSLPASGKAIVDALCGRNSASRRTHPNAPLAAETPLADNPEPIPSANNACALVASAPAACLKALSGLTYVEAVLWIGSRLAEGLHHAHERGILHRDLKPANVLMADDGQPMLLDFNLSEDAGRKGDSPHLPESRRARRGCFAHTGTVPISPRAAAFMGGTLPYMAPENLLAWQYGTRAGDARSDVYSLGVILYELLAGRLPFLACAGPEHEAISRMLADRQNAAPGLRRWNKSVSPAVEAIIQKCVTAEPKHRYASADDLRDDLERQLKQQPLRHAREPSLRERAGKWMRRHPRLASASGIAVAAAMLVTLLASALFYRGARLAHLEAMENLAQFRNDLRAAQTQVLDAPVEGQSCLEATREACRQSLCRFEVIEQPGWQVRPLFANLSRSEQVKTREDVGELLFLMAAMEGLMADAIGPPSLHDEHLTRAAELNRRAAACYAIGEVPAAVWQQRALFAERQGNADEARTDRKEAAARPPQSTRDYGMAACILTSQRRFRAALPLWQTASSRDPQNVWAWYGLGHCCDQLSLSVQATACYTACIALKPDFHGWYFRRGLIYLKQKDYAPAIFDFDVVLRLRPGHVEARYNRALARLGENHCSEAIADLEEIIGQGRDDGRTRFLLAHAREMAGDKEGAARERVAGMHCQPSDDAAWVSRAVARSTNDPAGAVEDLDRALKCNAFCLPAMESKANLLAERLGRTEVAVCALDQAVATYPENGSVLAARGVLQARLKRYELARHDAEAALSLDHSAATAYQVAGIYALLSQRMPADFDRAIALLASALRNGYGEDLIAKDKDLDPIRHRPQIQQLFQALQTLHPVSAELLSNTPRRATAD